MPAAEAPLISGSALQFLFATLTSGLAVLLFEPDAWIVWSLDFVIALGWLVLALSLAPLVCSF